MKSTYNGHAFKKGHTYFLIEQDSRYVYVVDEMGHAFNFALEKGRRARVLYDFFEVTEEVERAIDRPETFLETIRSVFDHGRAW